MRNSPETFNMLLTLKLELNARIARRFNIDRRKQIKLYPFVQRKINIGKITLS